MSEIEQPSDENPVEAGEVLASTSAIPFEALSTFVSQGTSDGLFPAIAFGMDPQNAPSTVGLLTSPIIDFPSALEIVERVQGERISPFRYVPLHSLKYIANKNAIVKLHTRDIPGLDTANPEHRKAFSKLMAYCTASRWKSKAFVLVDMVGFSLMSTTEQLSMRMSLGQSLNQCVKRIQYFATKEVLDLKAVRGFNRTSTGDGFYIWNFDSSTEGHVALFVLLTLLMNQVSAMFRSGASPLQLRAGFLIGEAYSFPYHGPSVPPPNDMREGFMPDAIGPALNSLSRLLAEAAPGQILIAPFDEPGRENRPNERLTVETMLTRVRSEILPVELAPRDSIKTHDICLQCDPTSALRITDKHKEVHHCYNVWGKVPNKEKGNAVYLQQIGVVTDQAQELKSIAFRPA